MTRSGTTSDFKDSIGDLPDDRLGTVYTVPKTFIDALGSQFGAASKAAIEKSAGDNLDQPVAGALTASANSSSSRQPAAATASTRRRAH